MPDSPSPPAAGPLPLVPLPAVVERLEGGRFPIGPSTVIRVPAGDARAGRIAHQLSALIGLAAAPARVPIQAGEGARPGAITLEIGEASTAGEEAYDLEVRQDGVTVRARTHAGLYYGIQTFRQLLPPFLEHRAARVEPDRPVAAPAVRIADAPRFGWRGAMLDVARHFFTVHDVKRFIDLLALHKLNRLHLHLSDDQGWRIEIHSWPNLGRHGGSTEVGGGRGGYYSQEEYGEIVRYAAEHFITVVPEIDMPGHTNAALASYPELSCDGQGPPLYTDIKVGFSSLCVEKEITYRFIDDVVREISALTPGAYFHIGGDEVENLSAAQYAAFVERVQDIAASHGKQAVGWDEIAQAPLRPDTIVQHWRPNASAAAAAGKGARVIVSVANRAYLDMKYDDDTPIGLRWAGLIDVRNAYEWDPADAGAPEAALLGVEAPLWSETVATIRDVEFLAFPRLAALAEVAWTGQTRRAWTGFRERLGAQAPRWSALGVNFYRSPSVDWAR